MIDYFYLLDYESDEDTGLPIVGTEPMPEADLAIENVEDRVTRGRIRMLQECFPQYDVRDCFEVLTRHDLDYNRAYNILNYRHGGKKKRSAEARM